MTLTILERHKPERIIELPIDINERTVLVNELCKILWDKLSVICINQVPYCFANLLEFITIINNDSPIYLEEVVNNFFKEIEVIQKVRFNSIKEINNKKR